MSMNGFSSNWYSMLQQVLQGEKTGDQSPGPVEW